MQKIKKGDTVSVIAGRDKGKNGKVLRVYPNLDKVLVERVNVVKKHMRRRSEEQQAGVVEIESPIHISNLMVYCKQCNRATKVGFTVLKDGSKSRYCKRCQEVL